jgi:deoxycytidylate deaminase
MIVKPNYLYNTAFKLAETSTYGRFRLGAIIAKKNKIVSMGTNQKKSHPLQAKYATRPHLEAWLHAEIHSLSLARVEDLLDADIYVSRILKNGTLGNSRPCSGCLKAIKDYGLRGMYFYEDDAVHYESVK